MINSLDTGDLQFIINDHGNKTAVIVPIDMFNQWMQQSLSSISTDKKAANEQATDENDLVADLKSRGLI